ncbi:MAG: GHKL domain-containing protein [Clostridia bacterium]|nr:GHKL domain-containing protein [Clostridia bacterium]
MITNLIQFLMTPNEVLNKLIICIFSFAESVFNFIFFRQILNISATKTQKYLYITLSTISCILSNFILPNPYPYLANLVVFFLLVYFIFKQSIKNTFIALMATYLATFIATYLAELFLRAIFKKSMNDIITIPIYYFMSFVLMYSFFYLIYFTIKMRKKIVHKIHLSLNLTIIINLVLGIITIFIQSYIFSIYKDTFPSALIIITVLNLLIYFSISMYSLIRTNKLEQTSQELETEKLYNKTLTLLHDNIRCFKHDFNNIVQAIGGYIALNDMDGLKTYYKNLFDDCKQTNNLNILNPEVINNSSIYSLLTNKYYLASEKGVKMTFDIFTDLSNINFNIYELTRILGILLDNAIEAAQETDEKLITIEFRADNKKQLFIIENSCTDNNISTTKIFEKGYSTKERNSGIGLWKVHTILAKNENVDLFTTVNNNKFRQQLEVFYK